VAVPARFEVHRSLGEGGFGVVYEAWDRDRERRVALKQLREPNAQALLRFKREFRSLADVSHPNLVRLEELVHHEDEWFFSMELVDGVDLMSWVRPSAESGGGFRLPFDEARLRSAFSQLAHGIAALHAADLLHRDLKPSNVLVTREGRVVILDFGLVAHLAPEDVSRTTQIIGTPAYMSPEQVTGGELTASSDWYGMGVMLYEALTGRLPFEGAFLAMMASRLQRQPPWPAEVVPGVPADLDALCRDLLQVDPASRPATAAIVARLGATGAAPAPAPPPPRPVGAASGFVGRTRELAILRRALEGTRQGRAELTVISGLSGMGKSALARHFLAEVRADHRALVLSARCYQRESVPYKAVDGLVDGLSRYLLRLPPLEAARFLPRDFGALARLFPVLKAVGDVTVGRRTAPELPDAKELRRRGFTALRELLARLADDRTVVLYIDDLQWGDLDSGLLLLEILQPPDPPPLLLLASYRSDEAAHSPLLRLLAERRDAATPVHTIDLAELTEAEARELAIARLGDAGVTAEVADFVARESGGSPFLLEQLAERGSALDPARAQGSAPSFRLESVIEHRLEGLNPESRRLLEVLAVAGRPLDVRLANQAAGLDAQDETAITELRGAHWVRSRLGDSREVFEAYHDRIRETVVGLLSPEVLPAYHNRIATALQASGAADPETLAEHYLNAGDHELAARHALRAADLAAEALAFDRAAHLYRQGLDLWEPPPADRARRRVQLAVALANSGRGAEAARAYLLAATDAAPEAALDLTRRAGEQFLISGLIREGLEALRAVLATVGMRVPATSRGALVRLVARRLWLRFRGLGFTPRRESEVAPDMLARMDICWTGAIGLGLVEIIQAAHFGAIHLGLALQAGEPSRVARGLIMELGFVSVAGGRASRRVAELRARCETLVREVDRPYPRALLTVIEGNIANLAGRFAESHAHCVAAQQQLREHCTGVTWELELAQLYELHSLSHLGRWSELARRAQLILADARERRNNLLATYIRTRILFIPFLAADDPDQAREEQDRSLEGWSGRGFQLQHYWNWYARTCIDLYAGDAGAAWERLSREWRAYRLSFLSGTDALLVGVLALRARVAMVLALETTGGRRDGFVRRAVRDVRRLERFQLPWAAVQATVARAGIASIRGNTELARALLVSGAEALGAEGLAAEQAAARWHLAQAGNREPEGDLTVGWMEQEGIRNPGRLARMLVPMDRP
jgi:hypothetical protein